MEKENLKKYPNAEKIEGIYEMFNGNEVGRILNHFINSTKQVKFYYLKLATEISKDNQYKFLKYLFKHGNFSPEQLDHVINIAKEEKELKELDLLDDLEQQQKKLAEKIAKIKEKRLAKEKK